MADELLEDLPRDLPTFLEALRHRREVPGVSGAGALAGGFPLHRLRA